jgi:hypothetical protein
MEKTAINKRPSTVHIKTDCQQMDELNEEIERVKRQIDELLEGASSNDPAVKANVKKFKQIKKFLTKKTTSHHHGGFGFLSMRRKKKQDIKNAINSILQSTTVDDHDDLSSVTSSELFETFASLGTKPNIASANIDDSVICGVECALSLWEQIKLHIQK